MSHDMDEVRRVANERSKAYAHKDGQRWTDEDTAFLLEFWVNPGPRGRDEADVARALQRTIEACRNHVREQFGAVGSLGHIVRHTETTTTTTHTVSWAREDDEEWDPRWYPRG